MNIINYPKTLLPHNKAALLVADLNDEEANDSEEPWAYRTEKVSGVYSAIVVFDNKDNRLGYL